MFFLNFVRLTAMPQSYSGAGYILPDHFLISFGGEAVHAFEGMRECVDGGKAELPDNFRDVTFAEGESAGSLKEPLFANVSTNGSPYLTAEQMAEPAFTVAQGFGQSGKGRAVIQVLEDVFVDLFQKRITFGLFTVHIQPLL